MSGREWNDVAVYEVEYIEKLKAISFLSVICRNSDEQYRT